MIGATSGVAFACGRCGVRLEHGAYRPFWARIPIELVLIVVVLTLVACPNGGGGGSGGGY